MKGEICSEKKGCEHPKIDDEEFQETESPSSNPVSEVLWGLNLCAEPRNQRGGREGL